MSLAVAGRFVAGGPPRRVRPSQRMELPVTLELNFEVDEVLNHVLLVDLGHMPSHGDITGIARRRRQLAIQIARNGVLLPAQVGRNRIAWPQVRFPFGRQPVLVSKPRRSFSFVLIVPIVCDLLVVVVEFAVLLAILIVPILSASLRQNPAASKSKQRCHTSEYPQTYFQGRLRIYLQMRG
jgi:hypothetical protein